MVLNLSGTIGLFDVNFQNIQARGIIMLPRQQILTLLKRFRQRPLQLLQQRAFQHLTTCIHCPLKVRATDPGHFLQTRTTLLLPLMAGTIRME